MKFINNFKKNIGKIFNKFFSDFKKELKRLEEKQNKNLNEKIDTFNKHLENIYENNLIKELKNSQEELKILKDKVKKINDVIENTDIPEIDKDKFTLFYSDDHPGALFQIYNDIRVILEKRTHIVNVSDELKEKIEKLPLNFNDFNLIPFKTENAPFQVKYFLDEEIIPDIAILDIIYGGIILENNQFKSLDGIDIGKIILEKNPNNIVTLYTSCSLNIYTKEGEKLKDLLNEYNDRLLFVDKDINDQTRIEVFYEAFKKLIKLNPEKFKKLKEKNES